MFGFVVFGFVLFGLVVFGLVSGLVSLGVPLGVVVFGLPAFGFVVPGVPVLGLVGVVPVGGFTEPVGGGAVDPGVRDCPADPDAEPGVPAPPGAACATIHVAHSKTTTESKVRFFVDMMEGLQERSAMFDTRCGFSYRASVVAE